jgi:hypothetical protein
MVKVITPKEISQISAIQDPMGIKGDNMNTIRREASRHFMNKEREYLKDKINELATESRIKNIRHLYRGINKFKKGYQPRSNLVKDVNGNQLADSHSILKKQKNYFSVIECT